MANAAHKYKYITIDVIELSINRCVYKIHGYSNFDQKPYVAENIEGMLTLRLMEEGRSYVIEQKVGKKDRTVWLDAKELPETRYVRELKQPENELLVF
jgi:hypothetical protein